LSDSKKRKLYDQYGIDGADAADQMPHDGNMPGGFGFPPGGMGGGGMHHMSQEDAQNLFSTFFGSSDPFSSTGGASIGGGGMPGISFSMGDIPGGTGGEFMNGGIPVGIDPISMMLQGGMASMGGIPGMSSMGGVPGIASMRGMPGMASMIGIPPQPKSYNSIPSGTVISLKGLVSASHRNGDRGVIQQFSSPSSRYIIQLEDSNETMSIKPSNLLQHSKVRIHDLKIQPELNGKTGFIIAYNESKERYNIYVAVLKKVFSLKSNNIVFDKGVVAQITGIKAKPELNGKWGTIITWSREANKYDMQLSAQQVVRVKMDNIKV